MACPKMFTMVEGVRIPVDVLQVDLRRKVFVVRTEAKVKLEVKVIEDKDGKVKKL